MDKRKSEINLAISRYRARMGVLESQAFLGRIQAQDYERKCKQYRQQLRDELFVEQAVDTFGGENGEMGNFMDRGAGPDSARNDRGRQVGK